MAILGSVPVLSSEDVAAAVTFYQQAFQFVLVNRSFKTASKQNEIQWAHLQNGDTALMLEATDSVKSEGTKVPHKCHSRLYFYTDDVDSLHHYLLAKSFQPGNLQHTDYHTREFRLCDPDGHQLTVGQVVQKNHNDSANP